MLAVEQPHVFRALGFSTVFASANRTRLAIRIHTLRSTTVNAEASLFRAGSMMQHRIAELIFGLQLLTKGTLNAGADITSTASTTSEPSRLDDTFVDVLIPLLSARRYIHVILEVFFALSALPECVFQ